MDYIFLVAASASVAVNGGSRDCGRDFVAIRRVGILAPFECNVSMSALIVGVGGRKVTSHVKGALLKP